MLGSRSPCSWVALWPEARAKASGGIDNIRRNLARMARRVSVIALDGVLDGALGVTLDVLAAANRIAAATGRPRPFSVRLVSARSHLVSGAGLRIEAQGRMADRGRPDVVVPPGLNVPSRKELEAALARPDVKAAQSYVVRQAARGALICAACSATFLCAESGLLDGGASTTSWWLAPLFRARYPRAGCAREDAGAGPCDPAPARRVSRESSRTRRSSSRSRRCRCAP